MWSLTRLLNSCAAALLLLAPLAGSDRWDKKPPAEWSEKELKKLLEDSPWAQTQVFSDTSQMFDRDRTLSSGANREINVYNINFRIRFLSAQPVRQAIARSIELRQKDRLGPQLAAQLKAFAASDGATAFPDYVIITVLVDSDQESMHLREARALLDKRTTGELKNNTFLELSSGRRVFLHEYQPPRPDGLGARFIFPRNVDGRPIITPDSGVVHFYSELSQGARRAGSLVYTLDTRFKVADMTYNGKLEY